MTELLTHFDICQTIPDNSKKIPEIFTELGLVLEKRLEPLRSFSKGPNTFTEALFLVQSYCMVWWLFQLLSLISVNSLSFSWFSQSIVL